MQGQEERKLPVMQSSYMLSDSQWNEISVIIEYKSCKRKVLLRVMVSYCLLEMTNEQIVFKLEDFDATSF